MRVEVINTGTELLLGDVLNTHLTFIAQQIFPLGLRVDRQSTVPDGESIRVALTDSFSRADLVFVTGGLGPTTDDITREAAADLLGLKFHRDEDVISAIEARAAARGFRLTDRIPRQAQVPNGAMVLANAFGTAPGLYLPANVNPAVPSPHLFLLPGPPRELRPMFVDHVLPLLRTMAPNPGHAAQYYRIAGVGESHVEEAIGEQLLAIPHLELGYCAGAGEVVVRIAADPIALAAADDIIQKRFADSIFATDSTSLETVVVRLLTEHGGTLAVAESCTGGLLASRLTDVAGASAVLLAGYVTYSNDAKIDLLGISRELIEQQGAVSKPVAAAMAEGARTRAKSTFGIGITGIAGPSGGSDDKPVGTVFIALAAEGARTVVLRERFPSDRATFKQLATQIALELLRRRLRDLHTRSGA
ncbi:MAG: competence/damage-inducible protein A [Chthoniobacterales bacterium]